MGYLYIRVIILQVTLGLETITIPFTGTPPEKLVSAESIYDAIDNQIITFGGINIENEFVSTISYFNLTSKTWSFPVFESSIAPPGLCSAKLALRSDRKLLVFFGSRSSGLSSDVYSFNLKINAWALETLQGDLIPGISGYASDVFTYKNAQYFAIFGGITRIGASDTLYLIDLNTLNVRQMPNKGVAPNKKIYITIRYYNKKLYLFGSDWVPGKFDQELFAYSLESEDWAMLTINSNKPSSRTFHYASIYKDSMLIFYGISYERCIDIWKFNFTDSQWSLIVENSPNFKYLSATALSNNKFYMIFGKNYTSVFNSIDLFEITDNSIKTTHLTTFWLIPPARKAHCSFVISDKMYIFGGISSTGQFLNDLWSYGLTSSEWTQIFPTGSIPSPRADMSCMIVDGMVAVLYFGRDSSKIYNDIYHFEAFSNNWKKYEIDGELPSPRFGSCICQDLKYIYVIGGQDYYNALDDIWMYDFFTNSFAIMENKSFLPKKLTRIICWTDQQSDTTDLYVIGGRDFDSKDNLDAFKLTISYKSSSIDIKAFIILTSELLRVSESAFILVDDIVYIVFGISHTMFVSQRITSFNFKTLELTTEAINSVSASYGHTAVHYKDSIYVFGGVVSLEEISIYHTPVNRLLKITSPKENSVLQFPCSAGTIKPNCEPCPAGTYIYKNEWNPCPAGTFSNSIAAEFPTQCIPCDFGTYSDKEGSLFCLDCPAGSYCPIGSFVIKELITIPNRQSNQPRPYSDSSSLFDAFARYSWITIAIISGLSILLILFSAKIRQIIRNIDIFVDKHSQVLYKPVVHKKTITGGLFSLAFLLAATTLAVSSIIVYNNNNITEFRSLVPISTLDKSVSAKILEIEVVYYYYGGKCEQNSTIYFIETKILESGFNYNSKTIAFTRSQNNCILNIKYFEFATIKGSSTILIEQLDVSAFASFFSVNISVTSAIPEGPSNIFLPIKTDSDKKVFKGRNPTIIYYEITPTIFSSDSGEWNSLQTGYHIIDSKDYILGDTVTQSAFFGNYFIKIKLDISLGQNGFMVSRIMNSTFIVLFGVTLGSIFGLAGSFATIMAFFEDGAESMLKKIRGKTNTLILSTHRKRLKAVFGRSAFYLMKVYPIDKLSETFPGYLVN